MYIAFMVRTSVGAEFIIPSIAAEPRIASVSALRPVIEACVGYMNHGRMFKKMNQVVEHEGTPQILGMVNKVSHLVAVEGA